MNLRKTLDNYKKENIYPFHMPGHKRMLAGADTYEIDMTEVENVDDLHDPSGPIEEDQQKLSQLYGSDESYILVGGSTVGNLSAIYGSLNENDKIIIPRNSHKSIYNGATIRHLKIGYIYPEINSMGIYAAVTLENVRKAIEENKDAKAVIITSPTYEGYHSPIDEIADLCHEKNMILIVDQAHGAHLGFHEEFTNQAAAVADITIQSLHKTLPCLTQTAVLHVSGDRIEKRRIREALDIFETSSPSYVLMNSVSRCIEIMENREDLFKEYVDNLHYFYEKSAKLKHINILKDTVIKKDPGKIVISTANTAITGVELAQILREKYKIETELSSFAYVLAMTSIMDSKEGFGRLLKALKEIDDSVKSGEIKIPKLDFRPVKTLELWEAKKSSEILMPLERAKGHISAGMICLYPPGSPVIVPGERITDEIIEIINQALEAKIHVTGLTDGAISVVN